MNKNVKFFLCFFFSLALVGCQSYKKVPYLQNSDVLGEEVQSQALFDARIMPKDLLTIVVSCAEQELAAPFNLTMAGTQISGQISGSANMLQQYLVDNNGCVEFPVLGTLRVGGLSKKEAEQMIIEKLKPYIKDNVLVTVRMANYKISVIGEVNGPGTFTIANEKVNVLEALAMAGDLSIYGLRDNVKLIREDINGHQQIYTLNLNDAQLVLSPYYYLQQNDILYITPNKTKAKNSDISTSTTIWMTFASFALSVTGFFLSIFK